MFTPNPGYDYSGALVTPAAISLHLGAKQIQALRRRGPVIFIVESAAAPRRRGEPVAPLGLFHSLFTLAAGALLFLLVAPESRSNVQRAPV